MPPAFWRVLRRVSQALFLLATTALVVRTTYPLREHFSYDVIPQFSPLLALTATVAARALIPETVLALAVVALTVAFGRAFCGWACPVGTACDAADWLWARLRRRRYRREGARPRHRGWRFGLLAAVVAAAAFGLNVAGWFDPLATWPRVLATSFIPYTVKLADVGTRALYGTTDLREAAVWLRRWLVPENALLPAAHAVVAGAFLLLLALGVVKRRFFCRYVCPTGALLSLFAWLSPFGRKVAPAACKECRRCQDVCRMGAIGGNGATTAMAECNLCLDCLALDKCKTTTFGFGRRRPAENPTTWAPAVSRRSFILQTGAGVAVGAGAWALSGTAKPEAHVIRPPGGQDEDAFLARCVRCGECVRVCLTQGLTPTHVEAGPLALWTPRFDMRKGYCAYQCTLCTEVCPSDALPPLTVEDKKVTVLGVAVINRTRCLPWAIGEECLVCEEMCPVAPKAIRLRSRAPAKPYVVPEQCIGCGKCEYACPVDGVAAIRVVSLPASPYPGRGAGGPGARLRRRLGRAAR